MSYDDHRYHSTRARQCRASAKLATDPDIRRRHEELAALHADRASLYSESPAAGIHEAI